MVLKYDGEVSEPQDLPGGSVQGSLLGIIFFIVELSDAGMPVPAQPAPDGTNDVISVESPLPSISEKEIRVKYVDDQSQGEVVRLDTDLVLNAEEAGPRQRRDRHGHQLPPERSLLQTRLNQIEEYSQIHKLKINKDKTKVMAFNFSTKYDFMPKLTIGGEQLEVVESTKLLGVMISSDLKWNHHTDYVVKKAKKRLWCIRRLSKLGASTSTLLDQYHLTTRSILELATPVFNGGLSQTNIQSFEEVQKMAFRIILKGNYHSYQNALAVSQPT